MSAAAVAKYDAAVRGFGGGAGGGHGAQVAADDPVSGAREADRLGADAAGAVQQPVRPGAQFPADETVECRGLAGDARVPVREDAVVVGGE